MKNDDRRVYFAENSDRYYDYAQKKLYEKPSGKIIQVKGLSKYAYRLLEILIENAGKTVTRDSILDHVYGEKHDLSLNSVDNHIVALRKAIDKPLNKEIIATTRGIGYRYIGTLPTDAKGIPTPIQSGASFCLTKSTGISASQYTVLYREADLENIENLLDGGVRALLLCGIGGIGKTALMQLLRSKVASKYAGIGWVEYHGTLKNSLLASLELAQDISDQETRWSFIEKHLKNDASEKILFIDNVDFDAVNGQAPLNDPLLHEILGWPHITVVITSRIQDILHYSKYNVGPLGNENDPEPCVDLFYSYYRDGREYKKEREDRYESEAVRELVALAGYHTYAIELLAKSAAYEKTLSAYLDKIKESGFQFPTLAVLTNYYDGSAVAAQQLRKLFNLYSRSEKEQRILWDFSVLPEGLALDREDIEELLLYTQNDMHRLCEESWVRFADGRGFYIHPLVREVIHFDLENGKAPIGTAKHMIQLVSNDAFISENISQSDIVQRLSIIENVAQYIHFTDFLSAADFYKMLGMTEYRYARKRLSAIDYLEHTLKLYQLWSERSGDPLSEQLAFVKYQLGYIKSTTHRYRSVAKNDLEEALNLWESLEGHDREIAMAHDHLGYVLTDSPETYESAKQHLTMALDMRRQYLTADNSLENRRAYATTSDNLGFLLSKAGADFGEAKRLLLEAMQIREEVYQETGRFSTDVAWTAFNLGEHLGQSPQCYDEAERYFARSLELRREQEQMHPNMYVNNIIFTLVAFAKLLAKNPSRKEEVRAMISEAVELKSKVDSEHTGYFSEEVENDIAKIFSLL